MATNFVISNPALEAALNNVKILKQPSATQGGTQVVNQELAASFEKAGEAGKTVRLVSFTCSELTENRTRSFTPDGANEKLTLVRKDSAQQVGIARIETEVDGVRDTFTVKMHTPVAMGFVSGENQVLIGGVGDITLGKNKGKKWLSLRLPNELSENELKIALETVKPTVPIVGATE